MAGVLRQGDELVSMVETAYESEPVLQQLPERHPARFAGHDETGSEWPLIRLEAWVVLGADGRSCGRDVVGQMLDCAANASAHWIDDTLRAFTDAMDWAFARTDTRSSR